MRPYLFAICLLAIAGRAGAEEPVAWTRGREAFARGVEQMKAGQPSYEQFRQAAQAFSQVAREEPRHPEAYLHLGRSCYLAGQLPEAIAAFHAGLAVDPFDGRLHEGLAVARGDVVLPADSKLVWHAFEWRPLLSGSDIFILGLLAASVTLPAGLRARRRGWILVGVAALAIVGIAGLESIGRGEHLIAKETVHVVQEETPFRVGNAEGFGTHPEAGFLPRGYEVRVVGERGGWLHVECPGGQVGWIKG